MLKCVIYKENNRAKAGLFFDGARLPEEVLSIITMEKNVQVNAFLLMGSGGHRALSTLVDDIVTACQSDDAVLAMIPGRLLEAEYHRRFKIETSATQTTK